MTQFKSTPVDRHLHDARRDILFVGAGVLVTTTALTLYGAHTWTEVGIVLGAVVVATAGEYGVLLPRQIERESAGWAALALSIAGILLVAPPLTWFGLSLVFGAAGALLGYRGRSASTGATRSQIAFVVGVLASIAYFAMYLGDALSQAGII
jgi:hypothetical protein